MVLNLHLETLLYERCESWISQLLLDLCRIVPSQIVSRLYSDLMKYKRTDYCINRTRTELLQICRSCTKKTYAF